MNATQIDQLREALAVVADWRPRGVLFPRANAAFFVMRDAAEELLNAETVTWCDVHEAISPLYEHRGEPFQSTLCKSFEDDDDRCRMVKARLIVEAE